MELPPVLATFVVSGVTSMKQVKIIWFQLQIRVEFDEEASSIWQL
jgi:hypothetical protein